jgi:hypothetical protein
MSVGVAVVVGAMGFAALLAIAAVLIEWSVRRAEQRLSARSARHRSV